MVLKLDNRKLKKFCNKAVWPCFYIAVLVIVISLASQLLLLNRNRELSGKNEYLGNQLGSCMHQFEIWESQVEDGIIRIYLKKP